MPGLDPGIHGERRCRVDVDGRIKSGHDAERRTAGGRFTMGAASIIRSVILILFVTAVPSRADIAMRDYKLPEGMGPHDVAPAPDGGVWFTAQPKGLLGHLDPKTGKVTTVDLGEGSAPHGVIVGPDGAALVTDCGANAITRVDGKTRAVKQFPLPAGSD